VLYCHAFHSQGDRFIPNRAALDIDKVHSVLTRTCDDGENKSEVMSPSRAEYKRRLADAMGATSEGARILAFKTKAPDAPEGHENSMAGLYTANSGKAPSRKAFRQVPTAPERILDAPELVDDYYLNLLDWSSSNTVAIALGPTGECRFRTPPRSDSSLGALSGIWTCIPLLFTQCTSGTRGQETSPN